jgi:hypothetical protein
MRLQSLSHLVTAIRALCVPRRIVILGSGALLASFPEIGEEEGPLERTLDGDFLLDPTDERIAGLLKDAIGSESVFFDMHGYYADCLRPEIVETFPAGWEGRLVPFADYGDVFALEPYDVALVKLVVGRGKDLALVRALLESGRLEIARLEARYRETPLVEPDMFRAGRNLHAVSRAGA